MASFKRLAAVLALFASLPVGASRYKTARALKFIYKHRKQHRRIIGQLARVQQRREGSRIMKRRSHAYAR